MKMHIPGTLLVCLLLAGCRSPSLGPKFSRIVPGYSRDEVLTLLGQPDSRGDVGTPATAEQWEYSDSDYVYLIRFGPKANESRSQWRVVGKSTHRKRSIIGGFAKVTLGQSREDVLRILGDPGGVPRLMAAPTLDMPDAGPREPLRTMLNGKRFEEWEYADGDTIYLVWFGPKDNEAEDDWTVIGKTSYRPEPSQPVMP